MSPTQRSLKHLRAQGYLCAITEKWNPYVKIRQDLFGFCDLLAVKGDVSLFVQTTSASNVSARLAKIHANANAKLVNCPPTRRIVVHGWKRPTKTRRKWELREEWI